MICLPREDFDALPAADRRRAIIGAVLTCSTDWLGNQRPQRWLRLWGFTLRRADFGLAIADFRNYLEEGSLEFPCDSPRRSEGDIRFIGAPELLRLYQHVAAHVPDSERSLHGRSLWDFPYGFAKLLMTAHLEEQGALEVYNHRQSEHDKFVAEQEALRLAEEQAAIKLSDMEAAHA